MSALQKYCGIAEWCTINYSLHAVLLQTDAKTQTQENNICNFKISALNGTWFSQAVINITTVCRLICYVMMMNAPRQRFLEKELNISSHAAVDWVNFCREVIILCIFMILFVSTLYILIFKFNNLIF